MAYTETRKAKIRSTGVVIEVYRLKEGGRWCNYADCTTTYSESELIFLS